MKKVFGIHGAMSMLQHRRNDIDKLLLSAERTDAKLANLESMARKNRINTQRVPKETLRNFADGHRHQGVIVLCKSDSKLPQPQKLEDWLAAIPKGHCIVVLEGIKDPRNLGACIRSANAAGVGGIILPRSRGSAINATVSRTAAGAVEITPIIRVSNLVRALKILKSAGYWIFGLELGVSRSLYNQDLTEPCVLVFGTEDTGLRKETRKNCDLLVQVPMFGKVQSMNVSVAVGVACFEVARQRIE